MPADCSICCETYNKSTHYKVTCLFCDHSCCRSCIHRYLLDTSNDPHCMNCKNVWNREFIDSACTKTFRNKDLKTHRENILLERQKCLMPETQVYVQQEKQVRELNNTAATLTEQIHNLQELRQNTYTAIHLIQNGNDLPETTERRKFMRKCPVENCKGFLSSQWKCEVCDNKICKDCNEIREDGDEHECKPENVKTVELLNKDTKPCPSCGTLIFKISGCSQMWCPSCHSAFNWKTGQIETGIIHNPHYYEFQRQNGGNRAGRVLGDIPCGGFPNTHEMSMKFNPTRERNRRVVSELEFILMKYHQVVGHISGYELRWNYRRVDEPPDHRKLRVKYMMNELEEIEFKTIIQKEEKAFEKKRDIANVLRMFTDTAGDLYRQFVNEDQPILDDIKTLVKYCNTCFEKIHKRYNCVTPYFNTLSYSFSSNNYKS